MKPSDVRAKYLRFFESKGHVAVPSSSIVPENDPTTLFTGSGMQPLIPYLLGEKHPLGNRITNSQKCFRSQDIEETGDNRHTTFFEMLGNWSLGDYFKKDQITWFWEFLTQELMLDPNRVFVTCYSGNEQAGIPKDTESAQIWKSLFAAHGIEAKEVEIGDESAGYELGEQGGRIFYYADKNWWSRTGGPKKMPVGEPGGPDTEVFYLYPEVRHDTKWGGLCHPNCDCGRYIELGNSVFMQYMRTKEGFTSLPKKNVDYGGGLERLTAAANDSSDVFPSNHAPILSFLENRSGKVYGAKNDDTKAFRIVADHMKAAVFLIADGVYPGNVDQGYFVRRLIRRAVRYSDMLGIAQGELSESTKPIADMYAGVYENICEKVDVIEKIIAQEEDKFRQTLEKGMKELERRTRHNFFSGKDAFDLFSTYGFPFEMTKEILQERSVEVDEEEFRKELKHHQDLSRTASAGKFKGGLADASQQTTMLHTCTHLMLAGLRKYLGSEVYQAGSNITDERTRFDFTYPQKVDRNVLDKVEKYVNDAIVAKAKVITRVMEKEEARSSGVVGSFWEKYPEKVTVYSVEDSLGNVYSRELCGGPHVESTDAIRGTFHILKEEASSAGVRRIKGVLKQ